MKTTTSRSRVAELLSSLRTPTACNSVTSIVIEEVEAPAEPNQLDGVRMFVRPATSLSRYAYRVPGEDREKVLHQYALQVTRDTDKVKCRKLAQFVLSLGRC